MKVNTNISQIVNNIKDYTFEIIDKESDKNLYTTISRVYRIEKNINTIIKEDKIENIDIDCLYLANYVLNIEQATTKANTLNFKDSETSINEILDSLRLKFKLNSETVNRVKTIIIESFPFNETKLLESKIISDANIMDFAGNQGRDRLKKMYEQMILKDFKLSKSNWYDTLIGILDGYRITTHFGQTHVQPSIDKLYKSLRKERKDHKNHTNLIL